MKYVIFDLDNCLVDDRARIPLIDWTAPNPTLKYHAYHAACDSDNPGNMPAYRLATATATPVFLTARPEAVRSATRAWISRWLGVSDAKVLMRQDQDHRHSVELKRDLLAALPSVCGIELADIVCAYDDREDIVAMYREQGITAEVLKIHDVCAYTAPRASASCVVASAEELEALDALSGATTILRGKPITAADVLGEMADTYRERNAVYGDNFKMVAKLMAVLFPKGVPSELVIEDQFHLFELVLVKLSRYAISNLTHIDSARDAGIYFSMCEAINRNNLTKAAK